MYREALETKTYIEKHLINSPKVLIVLGSGLTSLVDHLSEHITLPYEEIPHFKISTVKGHKSSLVNGTLNNVDVLFMTGRFHYYEGYSMKEMTFPFYVAKLLGIEKVILTNSCGGINTSLVEPGNIMVINDFINLMPSNPLIGENDERFGPRFTDMTEPYSNDLRNLAREVANDLNIPYIEGIYASFPGPYYETKAEIRMIGLMGADAVGMSTVPETIVCNYLGMEVLAFATITNMATGIQKQKHSHDHVVEVANMASNTLSKWIINILGLI